MADTIPNVPLPTNTWVDLYDETGVVLGTQIIVQNLGGPDVFLAAQASQPTTTQGYYLLQKGNETINDSSDTGAWAYCLNNDGKVNVRVA